jgi:hypothetical protein
MERGALSLADLYAAVTALEPDAEATARIARLLNLEGAFETTNPLPSGGYDPSRAPVRLPEQRDEVPTVHPTAAAATETGPALPARLTPVATTPAETNEPAWLADDWVSPLAAAPSSRPPKDRPESLFDSLRQRAVLVTSLATRALEGPPDIERIIVQSTELQPLTRLPRRPLATMRRGVQLLLDGAEGFAPFASDCEQIETAIEAVVGRPRLSVMHFRGCPGHGITRPPEYAPEAWHPPARSTVVAIVSDLGIGGPWRSRDRAGRREWLAFADRVREAGCPLVAFVPFSPSRWDPRLARAMTLIHWDRHTTARAVRRAVGLGHRVST